MVQPLHSSTWSFYDLETGEFNTGTVSCLIEELTMNIPRGCGAIEGRHDAERFRVDLSTGQVVAK